MKKINIFLILFVISLVLSCSKDNNSDENANATPEVIPLSPSDSTISIVNGQVVLTWWDNSDNETGFKIFRKTNTTNYSEIATVPANTTTYTDTTVTPGTEYAYYFISFNSAGECAGFPNDVNILVPLLVSPPVVTTSIVHSITPIGATGNGIITFTGNSAITNRGFVWSTSPMPTIASDTKTSEGEFGWGFFTPITYSSLITGLRPNTTYYVRAYASNVSGTGYGDQASFTTIDPAGPPVTDIDGNIYPTVNIPPQLWMQKNLDVTHYRNGDPIPQVTDPNQWMNLTTGAWCYYNNDPANDAIYGKLYNWYAIKDPRGLAPVGYHIPTQGEWNTLSSTLGGALTAGGRMKASTGWDAPNTDATNSSSFSGLPGGTRTTTELFTALVALIIF